jgi:uncharacterized protein (DUF2062 family)
VWKSETAKKALRRLRVQIDLLLREHASASRLGFAVGVGVLLGCSPFLGVQTLMGLAAGRLLRLNRLAQAGALLLHGHWLPLRVAAFRGEAATAILGSLFLDMLVGGALVGGALAILLGGLSALALWWFRR